MGLERVGDLDEAAVGAQEVMKVDGALLPLREFRCEDGVGGGAQHTGFEQGSRVQADRRVGMREAVEERLRVVGHVQRDARSGTERRFQVALAVVRMRSHDDVVRAQRLVARAAHRGHPAIHERPLGRRHELRRTQVEQRLALWDEVELRTELCAVHRRLTCQEGIESRGAGDENPGVGYAV